MADSIVVLDGYTLNPGDLSWDELRKLGKVTVHDRTPQDQILKRAAGAPCLLTNKTPLSAATIAQLPALKYVGVLATGYNVVDIAAAKQRGIAVTNVPTYGTDTVAQHAASLLLELARHTSAHACAVAEGKWAGSEWCLPVAPIVELTGKTLGIVGLGRIGLAFARIAQAMGMTIIAHDAMQLPPEKRDGVTLTYRSLDELFAESDAISLHCPLTPQTKHVVNAAHLSTMKPTAWIINTSRGPLIDEPALAAALKNGKIAGAALDVLDVEPPTADNPLLRAPNCIITAHIAWYAREARQRLLATVVENLAAFQAGKPQNVVNA
ncbi:MAG: D-2-hydroxyacid dehydrogenase [Phycisphaeraceae bacterium]|nr:D-2-hydroxyacid dehydrogenase [Phycisphaeraceae bacterium]